MKISLTAFTDRGSALAERITGQLKTDGHEAHYARCGGDLRVAVWTKERFSDDALIFVGAAGIAVRAIAPHVKSKAEDPAVVVIDETGKYAIPILSGHLGGANELALHLADMIGAEAVITTATDVRGVFAFDDWARRMNCAVADVTKIREISGALLGGKAVSVRSDFEIDGVPPNGVYMDAGEVEAACGASTVDVCMNDGGMEADEVRAADGGTETGSPAGSVRITIRDEGCRDALVIIPRIVCVGVGARRGTSTADIEKAVLSVLSAAGISPKALCAVCSIDLKANEEGIVAFAGQMKVPFLTYSAAELSKVQGDFSASEFVASVTGVDNVCERAAVRAARCGASEAAQSGQGEDTARISEARSNDRRIWDGAGELICRKTIAHGVTVALAVRDARLSWDR